MMEKSRKFLSPDGLWNIVFNFFSNNAEEIDTTKSKLAINIVDCLMACCAVFSLKFPSLLQYDKERFNSVLFENLKNLFHVKKPPSDTTMRERLDEVEHDKIRGVFKEIFSYIQGGKGLEQYRYINDHYIISVDGTQHFSSHDVFCNNCCVKNHRDGTITYHHQMLSAVLVHPDIKRVIPFAPEPILLQDGAKKNDCEQNAAKRLINAFRKDHPFLNSIFVMDALYSSASNIALLKEKEIRFIITAKPGSLKSLFDFIKGIDLIEKTVIDGKIIRKYKYINNISLNASNNDLKVNFLDYYETNKNGFTTRFSWITDIEIKEDNIYEIMRAGRARWNIENQTFNTLKNQGYNFEHNFGHGTKNLCTIMGILMMLAFAVDQIAELFNQSFQKAKESEKTYYSLWEAIRTFIKHFSFNSWEELHTYIYTKEKPRQYDDKPKSSPRKKNSS
jgi:hypothetical protein